LVPLAAGLFLGFFGWERVTHFPLDIRAPRALEQVPFFTGLVKRHLERGRVVTAKVAFVRSSALTLESQKSRIGVFPESKLKEMCKEEYPTLHDILRSTENPVDYGGKSCLKL
jgi:hypothetical protein